MFNITRPILNWFDTRQPAIPIFVLFLSLTMSMLTGLSCTIMTQNVMKMWLEIYPVINLKPGYTIPCH